MFTFTILIFKEYKPMNNAKVQCCFIDCKILILIIDRIFIGRFNAYFYPASKLVEFSIKFAHIANA